MPDKVFAKTAATKFNENTIKKLYRHQVQTVEWPDVVSFLIRKEGIKKEGKHTHTLRIRQKAATKLATFLSKRNKAVHDIVGTVYHLVIYEGRTESHEQQFFVK